MSIVWLSNNPLCGYLLLFFMAPLKFSSLNINGCREALKRTSLFEYILMKKSSVVFLQETHTDVNNQIQWQSGWNGQVVMVQVTVQEWLFFLELSLRSKM